MMVSRSLAELDRALDAAHTAADSLRLTLVVVDEPRPKPVQTAAELATDITDLVKVGRDRLNYTFTSADGDAPAALSFAQERWLEASALIWQLNSPERLLLLDDFVDRHDEQWQTWWPTVVAGLEALIPCVCDTDTAIAQCWHELTGRGHVEIGAATVGSLRVGHVSRPPDSPRHDSHDTTTRLTAVPAPPTTGDL